MSIKIPIVPVHYGHTGQPWSAGEYWLIEHVRTNGPRLFWMDALDNDGRTGWAYLPEHAAGFADKGAAIFAFHERGNAVVEGGQIEAIMHVWDSGRAALEKPK